MRTKSSPQVTSHMNNFFLHRFVQFRITVSLVFVVVRFLVNIGEHGTRHMAHTHKPTAEQSLSISGQCSSNFLSILLLCKRHCSERVRTPQTKATHCVYHFTFDSLRMTDGRRAFAAGIFFYIHIRVLFARSTMGWWVALVCLLLNKTNISASNRVIYFLFFASTNANGE